MQKKALRMSLRDVKLAVTQERMRQRLTDNTYTATCAACGGEAVRFLSDQERTDLFIAASALQK